MQRKINEKFLEKCIEQNIFQTRKLFIVFVLSGRKYIK